MRNYKQVYPKYDQVGLLEILLEQYGIENEGFIWCNNCGQELNLSEYETIEGFTNAGSHIITHERSNLEKLTDELDKVTSNLEVLQ